MKKITVVIYEDNTSLRETLTLLLDSSPNFSVVGSFRNSIRVEAEIAALAPDVILMDIDLPGINGIKAVQLIRQKNQETKILMLTVFEDDKNIFDSICAGANGYILKETKPAKLLEYIQDAHLGGAPLTSSVATQVLQMFAHQHNTVENLYSLSDREKEVLNRLVNGYSYKMIAADLFISIDTVRSHIRKVYEKLHVNSKSEAVAKAFRDKLF
jgi:DNA-binding NarL/FixJ family response regulator